MGAARAARGGTVTERGTSRTADSLTARTEQAGAAAAARGESSDVAKVEFLLAEVLPNRRDALRSHRLGVDLAALLRDAALDPVGPAARLGKDEEAVVLPGAVARQDLLITLRVVALRLRSGRVVSTPRPGGVGLMRVQGTGLERAKLLMAAAGGRVSLEVALRAAYHLQQASDHAQERAEREEARRIDAERQQREQAHAAAQRAQDEAQARAVPLASDLNPPPAPAPEPTGLSRALKLLTTPLGELLAGREAQARPAEAEAAPPFQGPAAAPQTPVPQTPAPPTTAPPPARNDRETVQESPRTEAAQSLRLPDPAALEFERAREALREAEAALGDLTDPRERYEVRAAWDNLAELETAWNALPRRDQRLGELRRAIASLIHIAQPLIDAREQRWAQHVAFLEEKARSR